MRLLVLTPEYLGSGGGIMTFYRSLVPALQGYGVDVRIIEGSAFHAAESPTPTEVRGEAAVEILERDRLERWWSKFSDLHAVPGLRRHLAAAWAIWEQAEFGANADIVEASDWGLLFIPPLVEAIKPLVVQCHGSIGQIAHHDPLRGEETQDRMVQLIERAALALACVQTYSRANAEFWAREACASVNIIRPVRPNERASEQPVNRRGLVVGRVQRWKGPQTVCAALGILGSRAPDIDWFGRDVPWQSRENSSVAHLAKAFPGIWGTRLVHHPPVPAAEALRRQAGALFNLIPSTWDMFNFTVVEAMVSGRPAIASTGAAASELIEDGVNGFVFPSGNAEALAATIEKVMSECPERLTEIGRAAQKTVELSLDPEKIAAERLAAYRSAIEEFDRNSPPPIGGWLGDICRPSADGATESLAFLDHHPLRSIISYTAHRLSRRVMPR